jgi:hypothetical protein
VIMMRNDQQTVLVDRRYTMRITRIAEAQAFARASDMSMPDPADQFSEEETVARREAALKRMLVPHAANPKREPARTGAKRGRPPKAATPAVARTGHREKAPRCRHGPKGGARCTVAARMLGGEAPGTTDLIPPSY